MSDATAFLWRAELAGIRATRWPGARCMTMRAARCQTRQWLGGPARLILAQAVSADDDGLSARVRQMEELASEGRYPSGPYLPALSRGFVAFERGNFPAADRPRSNLSRAKANEIGGSPCAARSW